MPDRLPPAVAYLEATELMASGSPLYRVHRPAQVLAHELDWLTFVTDRHAPPEGNHPWMIEVEGQAICPNVLIIRPTVLTEVRESDDYSDLSHVDVWDAMRRHVQAAQKQGQIVMLDLDDHPYAWNAFNPDKAYPAEVWEAHDAYVAQFNAVLCSTKYLRDEVMWPRFNRKGKLQIFEYAPNLYDPWRYHPERAKFGKVLGSHLYIGARDTADFQVLGDALRPVFEADPELRFLHIGEQYKCTYCEHRLDEHFEGGPCTHCECEHYAEPLQSELGLADATGMDFQRIYTVPPCSPWDLPEALTYNVGVVPLADSEWNYAKTEGKGFEMAAAGIPFVALTGDHPLYKKSPVGWTATWIKEFTGHEYIWRQASILYRKWAEEIAQQHQIEHIAMMKRLAGSNLAK